MRNIEENAKWVKYRKQGKGLRNVEENGKWVRNIGGNGKWVRDNEETTIIENYRRKWEIMCDAAKKIGNDQEISKKTGNC